MGDSNKRGKMMETTMKRKKSSLNDNITLTMKGMTPGKVMVLKRVLEEAGEKSAIAYDIFCSVRNAMSGLD